MRLKQLFVGNCRKNAFKTVKHLEESSFEEVIWLSLPIFSQVDEIS